MTDHLRRLIEHLGWADDCLLGALRRAGGEPVRALEIYCHVLGAEEVWLSRLTGRAPRSAVWPAASLDECIVMARGNLEQLRRFVTALTPDALRRSVHYANSAGIEFDSAVEDILMHVAMHGTYHRGQVALLLRDAGKDPAPTDFIAFVRGAPAATRRENDRTEERGDGER